VNVSDRPQGDSRERPLLSSSIEYTNNVLRRAVYTLNQTFTELKVSQHPDKTFIGRIERGFDFLGYYFCRGPLRLAQQTLQNHATRLHWLCEQQKAAPDGAARLDEYLAR
jgi:RNA-directed DNA polymerase